MYCTYMLTIASLKMFLRNRQALFFTLFFPLLILLIFGVMNFDSQPKMNVGLVTHDPDAPTARLVEQIRGLGDLTIHNGQLESELAELNRGNRAAVIEIPDHLLSASGDDSATLRAYTSSSEPMLGQAVLATLDKLDTTWSLAAAHARPVFAIDPRTVQVRQFRYIEFLLPGIIAMAVMQMSVFSVAHVFAHYREKGILKRLLATPMRPWQFVTANVITRLLVALAQTAIFIIVGTKMFHIHVAGSYWLLTLAVILGAVMFLGLGFSVSGIARTTESVPVIANLVVFPMLFIGNVFFSVGSMPGWLTAIANNLPLTFFSTAVRAIMNDGAGPADIARDLIGMSIWAAILLTLATVTFRFQERQIS